jgi:hypothetical protein
LYDLARARHDLDQLRAELDRLENIDKKRLDELNRRLFRCGDIQGRD